jgi:cell division protein ZapA (FtsZ GTPase activity inhibitor)
LKVAILAALNITDELFKERERGSTSISESELNETVKKFNLDLYECLKSVNP